MRAKQEKSHPDQAEIGKGSCVDTGCHPIELEASEHSDGSHKEGEPESPKPDCGDEDG